MAKAKSKTTTKAKQEPKKKKINMSKIASDIASVLKEDHVVRLDEASLTESIPHISTGSVALDFLIGGRENEQGVRPCQGFRGLGSLLFTVLQVQERLQWLYRRVLQSVHKVVQHFT